MSQYQQLEQILKGVHTALPFDSDYLIQSNPDIYGNYQTIVYKRGGASGTVTKTITLTFDANGNVLTYLES